MPWRQPSDPDLAEAIVASFHAMPHTISSALSRFSPQDWRRSWFWLDASGLSLYFLQRAEQAGFLDAIDPATVLHLQKKQHSNRQRSAALFDEFVAINRAFLRKRVIYANLKGFTLTPDCCPSPDMRLQLDLDFLVSGQHLMACRTVLEQRGYELTATTPSTWEFKAGPRPASTDVDPYQASPFRSVELHFNLDGMSRGPLAFDERLDRLSVWHYQGHSFPALSPQDQIIGQALHIFAHLRSAYTRPGWLLEFQRHVSFYKDDARFWLEVRDLAGSSPIMPIAFRVAVLVTRDLFGGFEPLLLRDWAEQSVSPAVGLWIQRYGRRAVMADFPGTKLYLLLERELPEYCQSPAGTRSPGLLPALRIPRLLGSRRSETLHARMAAVSLQFLYVLFRLRFHVVEGLRLALAASAWNRQLSSLDHRLREDSNELSPDVKDDKLKTVL